MIKGAIFDFDGTLVDSMSADTIVFEDAFHALQTANADGFITVAVYDPHEERQEELRDFADFFLESYHNTDSFWKFASA